MGSLAQGVCLHHIARETNDVSRLAQFYEEILGLDRLETPKFGEFSVVWLKLPPSFSLHIIEREKKKTKGAEEESTPPLPVSAEPSQLPRGHHVSFAVSNFDSFVQGLKEKGIEVFEKTQPVGHTNQVFFFDPDGNGLEVGSWEALE